MIFFHIVGAMFCWLLVGSFIAGLNNTGPEDLPLFMFFLFFWPIALFISLLETFFNMGRAIVRLLKGG